MTQQRNRHRILAHLQDGDQSVAQVAAALELSNTTAWRWLNALVADGQAYVRATAIAPHGGPALAVYRAGRVNANYQVREQQPKTALQITQAYRERLRASGDWEDTLAKQRAYYWRHKPAVRDPMTAAFFGAAS